MKIFKKILKKITYPRLLETDYNSDELLDIQRKILDEKKMMKNVFKEFYDLCIKYDKKYFSGDGKRLEIGAGVSFFKEKYTDIISSDIKKTAHLDMVVNAMDMPFENNYLRAVYGINCFHHFPEPDKFFKELERCLDNGGGCILIEPYYGFLASKIYKKLFSTETFDKKQNNWNKSDNNIMTGANQALSYIVFKRDKEIFKQKYQNLEIIYQKPLTNYLRYLLSGGLNFKGLCPPLLEPLIRFIEFIILPFAKVFALHHIIVIKKTLKE